MREREERAAHTWTHCWAAFVARFAPYWPSVRVCVFGLLLKHNYAVYVEAEAIPITHNLQTPCLEVRLSSLLVKMAQRCYPISNYLCDTDLVEGTVDFRWQSTSNGHKHRTHIYYVDKFRSVHDDDRSTTSADQRSVADCSAHTKPQASLDTYRHALDCTLCSKFQEEHAKRGYSLLRSLDKKTILYGLVQTHSQSYRHTNDHWDIRDGTQTNRLQPNTLIHTSRSAQDDKAKRV